MIHEMLRGSLLATDYTPISGFLLYSLLQRQEVEVEE